MGRRVVHKFSFPLEGSFMVIEGVTPKVVHVGIDPQLGAIPPHHPARNVPIVWIEYEPDVEPEPDNNGGVKDSIMVGYFGTGTELPDGAVHVGSVITPGGLVWHVYELVAK